MRFQLLARRIAAPGAGLALAATMAACSSSSSSSATAAPSSVPASSAALGARQFRRAEQPGRAAGGNAKAQITANWEAFFNGQTPAAKKISLLQNGPKFAAVINAQAGFRPGQRGGCQGDRGGGELRHQGHGDLRHHAERRRRRCGNQTGTAVYQGGIWKVGDVSFCQLLKLENAGSAPSVCTAG